MYRSFASLGLLVALSGSVYGAGDADPNTVTTPVRVSVFQGPGNYPVDPGTGIASAEALVAYQIIEERTNVDIDWYHPRDHYAELALRFATDNLTDLIITDNAFGGYPGGIEDAHDDGFVIALNDHLASGNAPNYGRLIDTVEQFRKSAITDGGMFLGFAGYEPGFHTRPSLGWLVRQDWLDAVDSGMPQTLTEWVDTMKAWRTANLNGNGGPVFGGSHLLSDLAFFGGAFGVVEEVDFMLDPLSRRVEYAKAQPEYRELLKFYLHMMDEGLIDERTFTMSDRTFHESVVGGQYGLLAASEEQVESLNAAAGSMTPTSSWSQLHTRDQRMAGDTHSATSMR